MRRFFLGAIVISILLVVTGIGATVALASSGSLQPGDALFPLQYFAEQSQGKLTTTDLDAAKYYIAIAGRRAADLGSAAGTSNELLSIYYLNQVLDQAALSVARTEKIDLENLRLDLVKLLLLIRDSTEKLSVVPVEEPNIFNVFVAKIESLQNLVVNPDAVPSDFFSIVNSNNFGAMLNVNVPKFVENNNADNLIAGGAQSIPFPANSPGAQHTFFPLIGEHANVACDGCHITSQYAGTAKTCEACHANIKPANHYQGDCVACHTPTSWHEINFDHVLVGATDCQACHASKKPANHFSGQCSVCHNTSAWLPANFSHSGQTDCQACHANKKPANHFGGQCSACHDTSAWLPANFNHSGQTDCQACHASKKPANHYGGQCSACHNTSAWLPANFNHSGQTDCQSCHGRPSGHYAGQCSQCHTTSTWAGAAFHVAGANCQTCHSRPSGHYSGQCSQCHTTSTWKGASGHFAGANCQTCHTRPSGHYSGQCSQCHTTSNWRASGHFAGANCVACHSGHTKQQCSNCHNTSSWDDEHDGGGEGEGDHDD